MWCSSYTRPGIEGPEIMTQLLEEVIYEGAPLHHEGADVYEAIGRANRVPRADEEEPPLLRLGGRLYERPQARLIAVAALRDLLLSLHMEYLSALRHRDCEVVTDQEGVLVDRSVLWVGGDCLRGKSIVLFQSLVHDFPLRTNPPLPRGSSLRLPVLR